MLIQIETKYVSMIPVLDVYRTDIEQKRPIIFILHGGPSCKENHIKDAYILAKQGYFVVLFDGYGSGELASSDIDNSIRANFKIAFDVYLETSRYINILIDSYEGNKLADNSRVGLIGFSMGGNAVFNNIIKERRVNIKAAVSYAGTPIWTNNIKSRISRIPRWEEIYSEEAISRIEKYVEDIQPYNYIENADDLPLLILIGEKDEIYPSKSLRESYEKMRSAYLNKDSIEFIEYKNTGHGLPPSARDTAFSWIQRHL